MTVNFHSNVKVPRWTGAKASSRDVQIYWKVDKNLFVKEDYFAIFDKEYLISKREQPSFEDIDGLIRFKNDLFNGLSLDSKKLTMFDGDIQIEFDSDQSIIYPREEVVLRWDVLNAHEVEIEPLNEKFDLSGVHTISIEEDTKFTLIAKNKGNIHKKSIFIRVLKIKEIHFDVEVFDTDSAISSGVFTVPSGKAGKYFFSVNGGMNTSNTINVVKIFLSKNNLLMQHCCIKEYFV